MLPRPPSPGLELTTADQAVYGDTPLGLFAAVEQIAGRDRRSTFLIEPDGHSITYGELIARTAQYANLLLEVGARRGKPVVVKVQKSSEIVLIYLACLRAGLIFLPINPAFKEGETGHILSDAEPSVAICDAEHRHAITNDCAGFGTPVLSLFGHGGAEERSRRCSREFATRSVAPSDIAVILYTSGTTGFPKGAMLTHRNIAANGIALRDYWAFTSRDVLLHCLPLFHSHGMFVSLSCTLLSGSSVILCPRFDIEQVLDLLPRATVFMGVPTMYVRFAGDPRLNSDRCKAIRLFACGSAPLLQSTLDEFTSKTGRRIVERYGMTETAINTSNPLDGEQRAGSVGLPLPGVEIRIVGQDGPQPGTPGNVYVRGPHVFAGYWRKPRESAEVLTADGWFNTGDIGLLEEGYLRLIGRSKDLIISGGYNVYPAEVERVIDGIPGVQECAVVGLPHEDFGEAVTAIVVATANGPSEAEIKENTKRSLANYKVPKRVLFAPELPRNDIGKVMKTRLREMFCDLYTAAADGGLTVN